jgi:hypothetical protein
MTIAHTMARLLALPSALGLILTAGCSSDSTTQAQGVDPAPVGCHSDADCTRPQLCDTFGHTCYDPLGSQGGAAGKTGAGGSTSGSGGAGLSGSGGGDYCGKINFTGGTEACTSCLQGNPGCCNENAACSLSLDCATVAKCWAACAPNDTNCQNICTAANPTGASQLNDFFSCAKQKCNTATSCGTGGSGGSGGTAGTGGSGGMAGTGGKSGSGGKAGSGGTAGVGGSAGSSGGPPALQNLGLGCTSDAACGNGMFCFPATTDDYGDGGPAAGYCATTCTSAADCGSAGRCFGASAGQPGLCFLGCSFGAQPFSGSPDPGKCRGRSDLACLAIPPASGSGAPAELCLPMCSSDAQCPPDRRCDGSSGLCVTASKLAGLLPDGSSCDLKADATKRQCAGACLDFLGDKPLYAAQAGLGHCTSVCVAGGSNQCGGAGKGDCLYGSSSSSGKDGGWGDQGFCAQAAPSATNDKGCDILGGFLAGAVGSENLCVARTSCVNDSDCTDGGTCKLMVGACVSYCLDRDPTYPAAIIADNCNNCGCGGESPCNESCSSGLCISSNYCCKPLSDTSACL